MAWIINSPPVNSQIWEMACCMLQSVPAFSIPFEVRSSWNASVNIDRLAHLQADCLPDPNDVFLFLKARMQDPPLAACMHS